MPAKPALVSAKCANSTTIKVTWKSVSGATAYEIYRKAGSATSWSKIATVNGNATVTYSDTKCTVGTKYTYTVRALKTADGKTVKSTYDTTGKAATAIPAAPKLVSAASTDYNSIKLTWNSVAGANLYIVKRKTGSAAWQDIKSVTATTYSDTGLTPGTNYIYTVQAVYKNSKGTQFKGGYNTTGLTVKPIPATPKLSSAKSAGYNSITVTWAKVTGAASYDVYRKTSSTDWTKVKNVTAVTYTDTGLLTGTAYTYTVRALTSNKTQSSYDSTGVTATPVLDTPVLTSISAVSYNSIKLTWNKSNGATKYIVYRKDGQNAFSIIADNVTGLSYTDATCEPGTDYTYTVKAAISVNSAWKYSDYNKTGLQTLIELSKPAVSSVTATGTGILTVAYPKTDGADGYIIYRKTGSSQWTQLATAASASTLKYSDSTPICGTTYSYTVEAYKNLSSGSKYATGYDADGKSAKAVPAKPTVASAVINNKAVTVTIKADARATGFYIDRAAANTTNWSDIGKTQTTSYTDNTIFYNEKYIYCAAAYVTVNGADIIGAKSSASSEVYMPLETPANLKAAKSGRNVVISFNAVTGASGYNIYRKTDSGAFDILVSTSKTSYTDNQIDFGHSYSYCVSAYVDDGVHNEAESQLSASSAALKFDLTAPSITDAALNGKSISINYTGDSNADGYYIYRKTEGESLAKIAQTAQLSYTDSTIAYGETYTYSVTAYITNNGNTYTKAAAGLSQNITVYPPAPSLMGFTSTTEKITVSFTPVSGISNYSVSRRTGSGAWQTVGTVVTGTSSSAEYNDTSAEYGIDYDYDIASVAVTSKNKNVSGSLSGSPVTNAALVLPVPDLKSVTIDQHGRLTVTAGKINKAQSYKLYRAVVNQSAMSATDKSYTASGSNISFSDTDIIPFTRYYYSVSAVYNGKESARSTVKNNMWSPNPPAVSVEFDPQSAGNAVSWTSEYISDSYKIYRKPVGGAGEEFVASTSQNSYTDMGFNFNNSYEYKAVIEYKDYQGNTQYLQSSYASASNNSIIPQFIWMKKTSQSRNCLAFTSNGSNQTSLMYYIYRSTNGSTFTYAGQQTNPNSEPIVYYNDSSTATNAYCLVVYDGTSYSKTSLAMISNVTDNNSIAGVTSAIDSSSFNKINITFPTIPGCTEYTVFRAKNSSAAAAFNLLKKVYTQEGSATGTYTDSITGSSGVSTYYYSVTPTASITYYDYRTGGNATVTFQYKHTNYSGCVFGVNPAEILSIGPDKGTSYTRISWQAVTGVDGYKVYRADSLNGEYSLIATVTDDTSHVDTVNGLFDVKYYKVLSYKTVNGETVLSPSLAGKSVSVSLNNTARIDDVFKTDNGGACVKFHVSQYDVSSYKYLVYRRESSASPWKYAGYQSRKMSNSFDVVFCDSYTQSNTSYEYCIVTNSGFNYSGMSDAFAVTDFKPSVIAEPNPSKKLCKIDVEFSQNSDIINVYRKLGQNGNWELLVSYNNDFGQTVYSYNDTTLLTDTAYYYKATAVKNGQYYLFNDEGDEMTSYIASSDSDMFGPVVMDRPDIQITMIMPQDDENGNTYTFIMWDKADGALGYKVYRKYNDGAFTCISGSDPISMNYFEDHEVIPSPCYTYGISALYKNSSGNQTYSDYTKSTVKFSTSHENPNLSTTGVTENDTIGLQWSNVQPSAMDTTYIIYRRVQGTSQWTKVYSKSCNDSYYFSSYYDRPDKHYFTYEYAICSISVVQNDNYGYDYVLFNGIDTNETVSTYYSYNGTSIVYIAPSEYSSTTHPVLRWNRKTGADGYVIYRKFGLNGTWQELATVASTSYTDTTVSYFDDYYYSLAAYKTENGSLLYSEYDQTGSTSTDLAVRMTELVNNYRAENGLSALEFNRDMWKAATIRAMEISTNFSHIRPDGTAFDTVLSECGVEYYMPTGENIAENANSYGSVPEAIFDQWIGSESHRQNILNSQYTQIGVGFYVTSSNVHYWTQVFSK